MSPIVCADTIKIAAIDWCPQICINGQKLGYTVDIITEVFSGSEYKIEIDVYPWSRAIEYVSEGVYDALLSPAKKEAPHLIFPIQNIGSQQMCFFTSKKNPWRYDGVKSLSKIQIGIANDTSIEELSDYPTEHPEQFQFQPYHERFVIQSAEKVLNGRIDAFIFTKNTTAYELKKAGVFTLFKNAGCLSAANIYIAFTPDEKKRQRINEVINFFEQRMQILKNNGYLDKLHKEYEIN